MIIDQLQSLASVQATDEIPVERGTTTYKATLQKLKDLVASLLTPADIGAATPNESGAGYCKMADGTLICIGAMSNAANGATINFPVSFTGQPVVVVVPYYNTGTTIRCVFSVAEFTANSAHVYAWDTTTNAASTSTTLSFQWQAIGRWK